MYRGKNVNRCRRVLQESDSQPRRALSPGAAAVSLAPSGGFRAGCVRSRRICGKFPHYVFTLVLNDLFPYIIYTIAANEYRTTLVSARYRRRWCPERLLVFLFSLNCRFGRFRWFPSYASRDAQLHDYDGRQRDKGARSKTKPRCQMWYTDGGEETRQ